MFQPHDNALSYTSYLKKQNLRFVQNNTSKAFNIISVTLSQAIYTNCFPRIDMIFNCSEESASIYDEIKLFQDFLSRHGVIVIE